MPKMLATVSIKNKKYYNITDIRITDMNSGEYLSVDMLDNTGMRRNAKLNMRENSVRIEVNGCVGMYNSGNCAYIFGNIVNTAEVGNSAYVEGFVKDFESARGSIEYDINISVKKSYESSLNSIRSKKNGKSVIIHVDGDISTLVEPGIFTVINGRVANCKVDNCLYIKGNIEKLKDGNMIKSTMGVEKTVEQIKADRAKARARKQREKEALKSIDELFSGFHNFK